VLFLKPREIVTDVENEDLSIWREPIRYRVVSVGSVPTHDHLADEATRIAETYNVDMKPSDPSRLEETNLVIAITKSYDELFSDPTYRRIMSESTKARLEDKFLQFEESVLFFEPPGDATFFVDYLRTGSITAAVVIIRPHSLSVDYVEPLISVSIHHVLLGSLGFPIGASDSIFSKRALGAIPENRPTPFDYALIVSIYAGQNQLPHRKSESYPILTDRVMEQLRRSGALELE